MLLTISILGICLRLSAGICAIWSSGLRHLNHRSLSHIVDKSRWTKEKLSCDTCYLAGWAEGDKAGSAPSYLHHSSALRDPSWRWAGWTGASNHAQLAPEQPYFSGISLILKTINKDNQQFSRLSWTVNWQMSPTPHAGILLIVAGWTARVGTCTSTTAVKLVCEPQVGSGS